MEIMGLQTCGENLYEDSIAEGVWMQEERSQVVNDERSRHTTVMHLTLHIPKIYEVMGVLG